MPTITGLDRPTEDPDNRVVIFLEGPWDMTMRKVPVQWGMAVRVPESEPLSLLHGGTFKITDYHLRYLVMADQLICVAVPGSRDTDRHDERRAVQVILDYARRGMCATEREGNDGR